MKVIYRETVKRVKQSLKSYKTELVSLGLAAMVGSAIGYYWWLIDVI